MTKRPQVNTRVLPILVHDYTQNLNATTNPSLADQCQSYKASMIVINDSRVVPDWKIPHIKTLES